MRIKKTVTAFLSLLLAFALVLGPAAEAAGADRPTPAVPESQSAPTPEMPNDAVAVNVSPVNIQWHEEDGTITWEQQGELDLSQYEAAYWLITLYKEDEDGLIFAEDTLWVKTFDGVETPDVELVSSIGQRISETGDFQVLIYITVYVEGEGDWSGDGLTYTFTVTKPLAEPLPTPDASTARLERHVHFDLSTQESSTDLYVSFDPIETACENVQYGVYVYTSDDPLPADDEGWEFRYTMAAPVPRLAIHIFDEIFEENLHYAFKFRAYSDSTGYGSSELSPMVLMDDLEEVTVSDYPDVTAKNVQWHEEDGTITWEQQGELDLSQYESAYWAITLSKLDDGGWIFYNGESLWLKTWDGVETPDVELVSTVGQRISETGEFLAEIYLSAYAEGVGSSFGEVASMTFTVTKPLAEPLPTPDASTARLERQESFDWSTLEYSTDLYVGLDPIETACENFQYIMDIYSSEDPLPADDEGWTFTQRMAAPVPHLATNIFDENLHYAFKFWAGSDAPGYGSSEQSPMVLMDDLEEVTVPDYLAVTAKNIQWHEDGTITWEQEGSVDLSQFDSAFWTVSLCKKGEDGYWTTYDEDWVYLKGAVTGDTPDAPLISRIGQEICDTGEFAAVVYFRAFKNNSSLQSGRYNKALFTVAAPLAVPLPTPDAASIRLEREETFDWSTLQYTPRLSVRFDPIETECEDVTYELVEYYSETPLPADSPDWEYLEIAYYPSITDPNVTLRIVSDYPAQNDLPEGYYAVKLRAVTETPGYADSADSQMVLLDDLELTKIDPDTLGVSAKNIQWHEDGTVTWEQEGQIDLEKYVSAYWNIYLYKCGEDGRYTRYSSESIEVDAGQEDVELVSDIGQTISDTGDFAVTINFEAYGYSGSVEEGRINTVSFTVTTPLAEPLSVPTAADLRIGTTEQLDRTNWTIETVTRVGYLVRDRYIDYYGSLNYQWYRAETDLPADAAGWVPVSTLPGRYYSEVPVEEGYEDYYYAVKVQRREDGRTSDWSELIKLSDIQEIDDYEITLDRVYFEDTGILNGGTPTYPVENDDDTVYMVQMLVEIYNMDTGECLYNGGYGQSDTPTLDVLSVAWKFDGLNKNISTSGKYIAKVQFGLYILDPEDGGWSYVAQSHTVLTEPKEFTLPDENTKVPTPTEFFRIIDPNYVGGGLDMLCWFPVEGYDVTNYEVMQYCKGDNGEWVPIRTYAHQVLERENYFYDFREADPETPVAYRIHSTSGNIQAYRNSDWSDYILIDDLKITLTDDLFTVDTSSVTADGTPKTKTVTPVEMENYPLVEGRDYVVTYADNTEVGTATLTVTGQGDYTGTLTYHFEITKPADPPAPPTPSTPSGPSTPSVPTATTVRETNPDGSVTETRTEPDGSKTVTVTYTNAVVSVSAYASDGTLTSTTLTVPAGVASAAVPVELPISDTARLTVKAEGEEPVKVRVTVKAADAGTVAVIVRDDGTEEIVRDGVADGSDVIFSVKGTAAVRFADNSVTFADTRSLQSWADDAVKFVTARRLMMGTGADAFTPDGTVSRGMAATVLYRLAYEPETSGTAFTDIADGKYYADAVAWAAGLGIVNGRGNGLFGAEDDVTREQLAAMLYRFAAARGMDLSGGADLDAFADASAVSSYAVDAMSWAVGAGIITGNGSGLAPRGTATRAEAAAMLARFCAWLLR